MVTSPHRPPHSISKQSPAFRASDGVHKFIAAQG
jgi:hypothetical protein